MCVECRKREKREQSLFKRSDPTKKAEHNHGINKARQRNPEAFIRVSVGNMRRRAEAHEFDLTVAEIMGLFERQRGKCAVTGLTMQHRFNRLDSISIDRIDNNAPHTITNTHLVCKFVNLGRRHHSLNEFINVLYKQLTIAEIRANRDWFRKSLNAIRSRCNSKTNKTRKKLTHSLTLDFLCNLYEKQAGKCAITGRSLTFEPDGLSACSIDRIDSDLNYTPDNVQLVCLWVNTAKGPHSTKEFKELWSLIDHRGDPRATLHFRASSSSRA